MKHPYATVTALVAIIGIVSGLAGWYFILRAQESRISATDAARGSASPLGGVIGSTYSNIVASLTGTTTPKAAPARLSRVSDTPVAGMGFTYDGALALRFVERATGYVLSADPAGGAIERLTNTLMPKTYEAFFARDGALIERSINEQGFITTFAGAPGATSTRGNVGASESSLAGSYLDRNILEVAINPNARELFSLVSDESGVVGVRSEWDGSKAERVFESPLSQWEAVWLADGRIILTQKAADGILGYAYELSKAGLSPLIRAVPGLTLRAKSSSGALLYGQSGNEVALFAQVSRDATAVRLPIRTSADKCVWSPGKTPIAFCAVPHSIPTGAYLDLRYAGALHTSDAWWRIDASAGSAEILYDPEETGVSLDVERPTIDDAGTYIAFMNGSDQSLWMLRIAAQ